MNRSAVTSSSLAQIGYNPETETLEIQFLNATLYQYFNVPADEYHALMTAPSRGAFLNRCIKGRYQYRRIQ